MWRTSVVFWVPTYLSQYLGFSLKRNMNKMVFLLLALMTANGASEMLWSVYCPSLRDTGMVSSATGYLDFISYGAAGFANLVFANAVAQIGWGNLILVWAMLMFVGVVIAIPGRKN